MYLIKWPLTIVTLQTPMLKYNLILVKPALTASLLCVFPGRRLLMPSSWSSSSIMSPNPTVPRSTDWAGQNHFYSRTSRFVSVFLWASRLSLYPGQISKVLKIQVSDPPVEPVTVASELYSQQPEGCVCECLPTHSGLFVPMLANWFSQKLNPTHTVAESVTKV